MRCAIIILFLSLAASSLHAQADTTTYPWPNPPFTDANHAINATFSEFRNTLTANHFHNGVDIGEPDGNPIYPVMDGIVYSLSPSSVSGSDAFVRVKTLTPLGWKHMTYVHIEPSPSLFAGMSVMTSQTVLGRVIAGMGHVHLMEREMVASENGTGVEINNFRIEGGVRPFTDIWAPSIDMSTLQFREAGTRIPVPDNLLHGSIEIVVRVNERNSAEAVGGTRTNNGTYILGYRLLSSDSQTVLINPPDNGVRYKFDRKPNDNYVGFAFDEALSSTSAHFYYVTNGAGASAINATRLIAQNAMNVDGLPEGDYVLHLFAEDTRGNRENQYRRVHVTKRDLIPPAIPTLRSVLPDSDGIRISWLQSADVDLKGYRLWYQFSTGWTLAANESLLTSSTTSYRFTIPDVITVPAGTLPLFSFRLTAVDTATVPNESPPSDVYVGTPMFYRAVRRDLRTLIVDGFDRWGGSGSWGQSTHALAQQAAIMPSVYGTSANEAVGDSTVPLSPWTNVHWILGDESTIDRTFTSTEQRRVKQYLESGGTLFVSGSEVGWDLDRSHDFSEPGDKDFYHNYLKATLIFDGNQSMTSVTGLRAPLSSYAWTFGQVFPEDYPDDIDPVGGSTAVLRYNTQRDATAFRTAGVVYQGSFGTSSKTTAKLAYLSFTFETIYSTFQRSVLMNGLFDILNIRTGVRDADVDQVPERTVLEQNYPNPFNPTTSVAYRLPITGYCRLSVVDLLGREVAVLVNTVMPSGVHTVRWDATGFPSGIYLCRLDVSGGPVQTIKMLVVK